MKLYVERSSFPVVRRPRTGRARVESAGIAHWALYDWANSAMACTIVTAVFPIYFSQVAAAGFTKQHKGEIFAWASTIAMMIVAVLAPVLGTLADERPIKKRLLGMFLIVGAAAVGAMYFIHQGDWMLAAGLFMLAKIARTAASSSTTRCSPTSPAPRRSTAFRRPVTRSDTSAAGSCSR